MSRRSLIALAPLVAVLSAACGAVSKVPPPATGSPPRGSTVVHAAGLSFGATVYQELSSVIQPDRITLNYQLSGNPQLIRGASPSSIPLAAAAASTNLARSEARRGLVYVPVGFGAVVVVYHLHGVPSVRLSAATLGEIFTGHIAYWNAPAIARENPGVTLPHRAILLVHLPNNSLMTRLLSRYLAAGSRPWRHQLKGARIEWPGGTAVTSEATMMEVLAQTPGAIGYLSQATALPNHLQMVALSNRAGRYISPTLAATTRVGDQRAPKRGRHARRKKSKPVRWTFTTINAPVRSAYPVSAELYALTFRRICSSDVAGAEGRAVGRALAYLTSAGGQALLSQMSFAPLPRTLDTKSEATVQRLDCGAATR
jgi:phosphate transport system substrate-binding protein